MRRGGAGDLCVFGWGRRSLRCSIGLEAWVEPEIVALRRLIGLDLWMVEKASSEGPSYSFELLWTTEGEPVCLKSCVGPHTSAMRLMMKRTSQNCRVASILTFPVLATHWLIRVLDA